MARKTILLVCLLAVLAISCAAYATDLDDAIIAGDLAKVQSLIEADPSLLNPKIDSGAQPLYRAAERGKKEIAEYLISKGAEVNAKNSDGRSVLSEAEFWQLDDLIKLLKDHGAK